MKHVCIFLIRLYQRCLSPFIGDCCRFHPSCSVYCIESIEKHGVLRGIWLGMKRICKCGPWCKGGVDEVP